MRFGDTIICEKAKDGGPESRVDGFWLFRSKKWFTIALLRFGSGSRDAYHTHAFWAVSWLLSGWLTEYLYACGPGEKHVYEYLPSLWPIFTPRDRLHKVFGGCNENWVLTIRGPWQDTWREVVDHEVITLTHNRVRVT